jgi:predicted deacylase
MSDIITINGDEIGPGEHKEIQLNIARLPTYTNIDLPVHVFRAEKEGPGLLLTGALHGDELNGVEIIRRMVSKELLMPEQGTVIAIPIVNVYGFIQNVRGLPDGKDINRSFPGVKGGSLARLLAHTIMNQIVPKIDYGIDFHTGGASRANYPQIRCVLKDEKNKELAKAFKPPFVINSSLINKSFRKAAHMKGKPILVYETGESTRFDETGIQEGINGTLRLMKYLGMTDKAPEADHKPEFYNKTTWIRAEYAGLFQPKITLGEKVSSSQLLGYVTDPYGNEHFGFKAPHNGRIIGLNHAPMVHKGDALLHLAY